MHTYICVYVYIYTHIYICIHTYIYTYVCIYPHFLLPQSSRFPQCWSFAYLRNSSRLRETTGGSLQVLFPASAQRPKQAHVCLANLKTGKEVNLCWNALGAEAEKVASTKNRKENEPLVSEENLIRAICFLLEWIWCVFFFSFVYFFFLFWCRGCWRRSTVA